MEEEHFEVFKKPSSATKIWRYTDFTKFVSLLSKRSLYFARMDLLDDKFEGSLPRIHNPKPPVAPQKMFKEVFGEDYDKQLKIIHEAERKLSQKSSQLHKSSRKMWFINSWSATESESAAMWRVYLKSNEGIAIQSTFKRLSDSIIQKENIRFGLLNYVDTYESTVRDFSDALSCMARYPFMFKRKCFEYETELRAILFNFMTEKDKRQFFSKPSIRGMPKGLYIEVDLPTLIERVYISPYTQNWFSDLVKSVVDKYGFQFEVLPSSLADKPYF